MFLVKCYIIKLKETQIKFMHYIQCFGFAMVASVFFPEFSFVLIVSVLIYFILWIYSKHNFESIFWPQNHIQINKYCVSVNWVASTKNYCKFQCNLLSLLNSNYNNTVNYIFSMIPDKSSVKYTLLAIRANTTLYSSENRGCLYFQKSFVPVILKNSRYAQIY